MASSTVSSRWMLLAAGATLVAVACGDDDKGSKATTPTVTTDASVNPATGSNNAPGPGLIGKACTTDTECGSIAKCGHTQGLGTLGTLAAAVGLPIDSPAPGGYCSLTCDKDADCGQGSVCLGAALGGLLQGECRKSCNANTDCRPNYECAKPDPVPARDGGAATAATGALAIPAQCQALPATDQLTDNQTGLACSTAPDAGVSPCGDGVCAAGACTGVCTTDSHCGANGACIDVGLPGSAGTCQETCNVDTDCARYVKNGDIGCNPSGARKLCGLKQFPLDPGLVGKACTATTECGSGECAQTLGLQGTPAPGGYCTLLGCADSTSCGGGTCLGTAPISGCYVNCKADTDCRSGYQCQDRATGNTTTPMAKVCAPIPPVRDGGVASGATDAATPSPAVDAGVAAVVDAG
jgi:hypothetical protein